MLVVSPECGFAPTGDGDDPTVDLRVDDAPDPVASLARLLKVRDAHLELIRSGMVSNSQAAAAHLSKAHSIAPDDPNVATQYAQHAVLAAGVEHAVALALAAQRANPNAVDVLRRRIGTAAADGDRRAEAFLEQLDRAIGSG